MIHDYKSCWPTLGPFRYSRGAQKGPFGLKQGLTGRKAPGARFMTRFGPYCRQLVWLGCNHGYHTLWPGAGTLLGPTGAPKGPVLTQNAPFGGPGGPLRAPRGQIWSQKSRAVDSFDWSHNRFAKTLNFGPIWALLGSKRDILCQNRPSWGSWPPIRGPIPGLSLL